VRQETTKSVNVLIRLLELCKHSDDLSDEEKVAELFPISVQQHCVLLRLGKLEEAKAVALEVRTEE
jgi:signal recognition particle subunit SRP72